MKVGSWNIEGRLTRFANEGKRGSPEHILRGIERLGCDIIILPEAFDDHAEAESEIMDSLKDLGYAAYVAAYHDSGERENEAAGNPVMMLLSRLSVTKVQTLRPGNVRNMLALDVIEPDTRQLVRIFGIHLDDRSEENRLKQINDLIPCINASPYPVIALGDFNAMHRDSLPAHIFRSRTFLKMTEHLPHARTKDILRRLSEMAIGDTMSRIKHETRLVGADPGSRPTTTPKMRGQEWMPSFRLAQIDHIFASPELTTSDYSIERDGGSDHRAISVNLILPCLLTN